MVKTLTRNSEKGTDEEGGKPGAKAAPSAAPTEEDKAKGFVLSVEKGDFTSSEIIVLLGKDFFVVKICY